MLSVKKSVFLFLLLAVSFFSCSDDDPVSQSGNEMFDIPSTIGTYHTYRVYCTEFSDEDTVTIEVLDKIGEGYEAYYITQNYFSTNNTMKHYQKEDGYYFDPGSYIKVIPYPWADGKVYTIQENIVLVWGNNEEYKDTVDYKIRIQENVNVELDAGNFNCLLANHFYQTKDGTELQVWNAKYYFAEGIGLVRIKGNFDRGNYEKITTMDLLDYHIAK